MNVKEWGRHFERVGLEAAALSYASLFSIVPLISLVIVLLQLIIPETSVLSTLEDVVRESMGESFAPEMVGEVLKWIRLGIDRFYSWKLSWLSVVSIILLVVVAVSLLQRILKASFRTFQQTPPPLVHQAKRLGIGLSSILFVFLVSSVIPLLIHFFEAKGIFAFTFRSFGTVLQVILLSWFLRSLYPFTTTIKVAFLTTVLGLIAWKSLNAGFKFYAVNSFSARSIFGAWAFFPLLLVWLYFEYFFLFACLGVMHALTKKKGKWGRWGRKRKNV